MITDLLDLNAAYIMFITVTAIDLAIRLWAWNRYHDDRIKHEFFWWRYY